MIKAKGTVIADCQKVFREFLYQTTQRDAATMRDLRDERSYVIESLLLTKPIQNESHDLSQYDF